MKMCDVGEKGTKAFITEEGVDNLLKKIDRLNNDIKTLLKENEAKEKVIKKQDYVINELEKELNKDYETYICKNKSYGKTLKAGANIYREHILYKLKELKENRDER
jgi:hypothetical protein